MSTSSGFAPKLADGRFDDNLSASLVELRRDLHRHPELSLQEERTCDRLADALAKLGVGEVRRVAGTGLVARIAGRDPRAPKVALRGDIDALPITESTGLPYASVHPGVMHACGHDVHATWAVGAAALLARAPAAGDVLVILQPAEEIGLGALRILESGALDHVAAIFGAHVDRRFAVGQVVADVGAVGAAADAFDLRIEGKGGHGARPHLTHDPIVAGCQVVAALQTLVSRRVDPGAPAVVTIGRFHAGTAPNIIPDQALLSGTLRSMDPATRSLLASELRSVAEQVGSALGVRVEVEMHEGGSPPVINDARATAWARQAAIATVGESGLVPQGGLNMGGEDFAFYLERIPGCFLRVGAREPGGEVIGAHTPQFFAAEEAVFVGATVLAEAARIASRSLQDGG